VTCHDAAAEAFATSLRAHGLAGARLVVAYSGGPDSTLLLAVAAETVARRKLRAIHIDHGWHAAATAWADQCRAAARRLGVRCEVVAVDSRQRGGEGAEAAARAARYQALQDRLATDEVLLTAHHADDQAETVLFALLRGGGSRGLAGMPALQRMPPGWHLRPLLDLGRADIRAAAERRGLDFIDDPANHDTAHDRVFLRERVLPLLRERWPAIDRGLVRSGRLAAEAVELEESRAAADYARCRGSIGRTLDCAALCSLPAPRQRALMRWWLRREGIPLPASRRIDSALAQFAEARAGRNPRIAWSGGELRRWGGRVWLRTPRPRPTPGERRVWTATDEPIDLPEGRLLPARLAPLGGGEVPPGPLTLVRRQGGERLRCVGATRARAVTTLLREAGLPPWERDEALLVWRGDDCLGLITPRRVLPAAAVGEAGR